MVRSNYSHHSSTSSVNSSRSTSSSTRYNNNRSDPPPPRRGPNHYRQRGGYAPPPPPTSSSSSSSNNNNAPLFTPSSFPAPLPPRRPNPSSISSKKTLHYDTTPPAALSPSVKFRSADSTQRTMNELAQKRYEKMEKKRAGTLLMGLLCLAIGAHFMTTGGEGGGGGGGGLFGFGVMMGGGHHEEFHSLRSKEYNVNDVDADVDAEDLDIDADADDTKTDGGGGDGDGETKDGETKEGGEAGASNVDPDDQDSYLPEPEEEKFVDGEEYLVPVRYYANIRAPRRRSDSPFFFHIPRSGGQTVKDIVGKCLGLVQASNVGVMEGHGNDPDLAVITVKDAKYVNVDTTSIPGLERATKLGLTKSKEADLITSPLFHDSASLFDLYHQGRAFTLLRHPVERAVSMYYYRTRGENADIDPSVSLEDYAQGNGIENNWMTRFLVNQMEGELTKDDLDKAMDILQQKFLIGFLDDGEESVARMMKYFGWTYSSDPTKKMLQEDCVKELIDDGTNVNIDGYELPKKGTQAYALIMWQTQFDVKLYEYAKEVFDGVQTKHWGTKARKKMMKKKKGGK